MLQAATGPVDMVIGPLQGAAACFNMWHHSDFMLSYKCGAGAGCAPYAANFQIEDAIHSFQATEDFSTSIDLRATSPGGGV